MDWLGDGGGPLAQSTGPVAIASVGWFFFSHASDVPVCLFLASLLFATNFGPPLGRRKE